MGNLATPKSVHKLQTALHAKAKAEAGYRFYALYDKISRDDILAHAYAQCRSGEVWKRSHGRAGEAPPNERGGNRYVRLTATAPHLDSTKTGLRRPLAPTRPTCVR